MNKFFSKVLDDKRGIMILSLLCAVIGWLVVVNTIDKQTKVTLSAVPIQPAFLEEDLLTPLNLNIVPGQQSSARVEVEGDGNIIGGLTPEDVQIYADLTGIDKPGEYNNVPLLGRDVQRKGFTIRSIEPSSVSLRVDRMTTKTFNITADVTGLLIPEGYLGRTAILNPSKVSITGPDLDIQRIDKCVAVASFSGELNKSSTVRSNILLFDREGNQLSGQYLKMDAEQTDITVPVYMKKNLKVAFEYLHVPRNLNTDDFDYTMSVKEILVAGTEDQLENLDIINVGYVDVTELTKNSAFSFEVDLPTGLVNLDNTNLVDVMFELPETEQMTFTIPGENITITNMSLKYTTTVESRSIPDVTIVGSKEVLSDLTAGDIVAEVDFAEREVVMGSNDVPVRIFLPGGGFAWATGRYTAVVNVKLRDNINTTP